ncbi:cell division protein FtsA [Nibrella saemangeumensis]|uniref:Cell division protein FtsA n=1 Tax=Nibrella saemangeumensis TaxID=1084526 RepID=A0ABP8NM44_9BACT
MTDEKIVVGLDIGSTKVCAVAGRLVRNKDHATIEVLGVGRAASDGVNKGSVVNITKTARAIEQAISEAANQSDLDIQVVNVNFSGQHIAARRQSGSITRSSPGDEVTTTDINHLLGDMYRTVIPAGMEIVHVLPMDFTVDNELGVEDPVGRNGVKLGAEFQIITAQTNAATNTRKCVERADNGRIKREQMLLSPLASSLAVLTSEEREAGVALVDIGGGTTDLAIYHRNVLRHMTVFPWAGNTLTADIQEGCKVLPHQAELLKTKFGNADPTEVKRNEVVSVPGLVGRQPKDVLLKNVAIIMEERLKEIAAMVQAEIIRSGYEHKLLGGIVLTGGTASVPGIERIFQRVTGMDVRIGYPDQLEHNPRADLVGDPAYATALGLVWAGFKQLDERISFVSDPGRQVEPRPMVSAPQNPVYGRKEESYGREKEKVKEPEKKEGFGVRVWGAVKRFLNDDIGNTETY